MHGENEDTVSRKEVGANDAKIWAGYIVRMNL